MDRITESLLDEFAREHDLTSLSEDKRFEHFAAHVTIRRHYGETLNTSDVVTGAGGDGGIDAIAVLVNGALITDVDAFMDQSEKVGNLDVTFVFIQAERSSSFNAAKIGTFGFGVLDFFKEAPALPQNPAIKEAAQVMAAIYKQSSKFKRARPACKLYYVTTGQWQGDPNLEARRANVVADLNALNLFQNVEFQCIGASDIQRLYAQTKNAISREFLFLNRAVIPELQNVAEAYLGFIPVDQFLPLITEDGEIIKSIFYDNVRDWQDYNEVNNEIRETLTGDKRAHFVLMNNGVTIIARTVRTTGNRFNIEDYQIVNGCQTSHVVFDNRDNLDPTVMIPLRLIGTQDEDVINSIVKATNRQTEVKREQFLAMRSLRRSWKISLRRSAMDASSIMSAAAINTAL